MLNSGHVEVTRGTVVGPNTPNRHATMLFENSVSSCYIIVTDNSTERKEVRNSRNPIV